MALTIIIPDDSFQDWFNKQNEVINEINKIHAFLEVDTHSTSVGMFGYIDSSGTVQPADASSSLTYSNCFVIESANPGKAIGSGYIKDVQVENAVTVSIGDSIYLSENEPGKVTNVLTGDFLGIALTATSSHLINMWYKN